MKKKGYSPMKGIMNTNKMLMTETIGYGVAGKLAGMDTTGVGNTAFKTGSSLAGVPSLTMGAGTVMGSLSMLDQSSKKRRK